MANPKHLKILKQGVEVWNKWRKKNPDIKPDLSGADLKWANLFERELREANLSGADLTGAQFLRANLSEANLCDTALGKAYLSGVKLRGANLFKAYLGGADLTWANLQRANLENAILQRCLLVETNLSEARLTGAMLYGSARDNWNIKDVKCEYIYWDEEVMQRSPKDRDFEPGEFERLYAALPTIEYIFENGMTPLDPLIMDRVVQDIREKNPEFDIKIDSINARGLAPSIKFTVQHKEHKEPVLAEVQRGYDERINRLEAEKDRLYDLLGQAIDKDNVKLIAAGRDATVAMDSATINIEQHIHNALELQRAIGDEPEESKSFTTVAKKTALEIIGEAIKDIAKGQVKEAAKEIIKLGKDLGPIFAAKAAYMFFKGIGA